MSGNIRRSMPLFPIGIVMQLTELSARQIRYYEDQGLISPARTEGNRRLFSFNDVDKLLEIRELIEQGVNIAGIKKIFTKKVEDRNDDTVLLEVTSESNPEREQENTKNDLSDDDLRKLLRAELMRAGRFNTGQDNSLHRGNPTRFLR